MNFDRMFATMIPHWQLKRMAEIETWKAEMQAFGLFKRDWVDRVLTQCSTAATMTVMPNWIFENECMERIKGMAQRGDIDSQIDEWITNLPDELLMTLQRERLASEALGIYKADWPGGPGAIFKKE